MKVYLVLLIFICAHSASSNSLRQVHNIAADGKRIICYFGSWAVYRPDLGKFDVENIDPYLCTHVIYSFAGLDPDTNEIYSLDPYNDLYDDGGDGAYIRFTNLANVNPDLKCLLSVGGWDEDPKHYSDMANDPEKRATFVASVAPYLRQYGFHGLDLDWEYPDERGGVASDKEAYSQLLQDLKESFADDGFLLSIAVSGGKDTIDAAYNVPEIVLSVDFINLMTYDFHGSWEDYTGANAPLSSRPGESKTDQTLNDEFAVNYWLQLGAPASIINLGMPIYGNSYILEDQSNTDYYSPTSGPGDAGPYTDEAGTLGYNEVCVSLQNGGWIEMFDDYYKTPYAYQGNQWVSYENTDSIAAKCQLVINYGLGGAMIWSLDTDDFQPTCGSTAFPLLTAINDNIRGDNSKQ